MDQINFVLIQFFSVIHNIPEQAQDNDYYNVYKVLMLRTEKTCIMLMKMTFRICYHYFDYLCSLYYIKNLLSDDTQSIQKQI